MQLWQLLCNFQWYSLFVLQWIWKWYYHFKLYFKYDSLLNHQIHWMLEVQFIFRQFFVHFIIKITRKNILDRIINLTFFHRSISFIIIFIYPKTPNKNSFVFHRACRDFWNCIVNILNINLLKNRVIVLKLFKL